MLDPLRVGFGRLHVRGWTYHEAAWLIEGSCATQAERMHALSPAEAQRWVRLAELEVSSRVERRLLDHEVLVLVYRSVGPRFEAGPPPVDLTPDEAEPIVLETPTKTWVEIEVRTAGGAPAMNTRYVLTLPDGTERRGTTDARGMIRVEDLDREGDCTLRFPEHDEH